MLIELSCDCHVAAEDIGEITVNSNQHITVRMKSGVGHRYFPRYGEGVYAAKDRLVKEVNGALDGSLSPLPQPVPKIFTSHPTVPPSQGRLVCALCLGTGRITYGNDTSEDCRCQHGGAVLLVDPAEIPE